MKVKTKVLLIIGAAVIVVCGAGAWGFSAFFRQTTAYMEADALAEADTILATLGKTWSMPDLKAAASADFLAVVNTEEDRALWLKTMKDALGGFKEGSGRIEGGIRLIKDFGGEDAFGAVFVGEPVFEKRKAKVAIQLIQRPAGGGWQMSSFAVEGVAPPVGAMSFDKTLQGAGLQDAPEAP